MKLLPPKELNTKIAEQKKSEIDAGLFLAKKVDALREAVADAQKEHDDQLESIRQESEIFTIENAKEKGRILKEIEQLKEERRILRIPLDAEWSKVKKESEINSEFSLSLIEREFNVKNDEKFITERFSEIAKKEEILTADQIEVSETFKKVTELERKAVEDAEKAKQIREDSKTDAFEREKNLTKRENDVSYREIDTENKLKNALIKQKENEKETKRIESKQRQLQAAFAELEKRNG